MPDTIVKASSALISDPAYQIIEGVLRVRLLFRPFLLMGSCTRGCWILDPFAYVPNSKIPLKKLLAGNQDIDRNQDTYSAWKWVALLSRSMIDDPLVRSTVIGWGVSTSSLSPLYSMRNRILMLPDISPDNMEEELQWHSKSRHSQIHFLVIIIISHCNQIWPLSEASYLVS